MKNYFKSIEQRTDGRLKFEFYPAGPLYTIAHAVEAVTKGVTDIATVSPEFLSKQFPATTVATLAGLTYPDTVEGLIASSKALMALAEKFPAVQNEWKDFKVLWYMAAPGNVIYSTKKDIKVPSDLKGLKLGGIGATLDIASIVGAAPVLTSPPDAYMSMKTGVIDAYATNYVVGLTERLYEVTKYVNEYSFGGGGFLFVMNWDTWNKISPADQKLIMDTVDEANKAIQETHIGSVTACKQEFAEAGAKINMPGPEWDGVAEPLWDNWKADATAAGVENPDEILNYWKKMRDDFLNK